jgi:hypothetical protein
MEKISRNIKNCEIIFLKKRNKKVKKNIKKNIGRFLTYKNEPTKGKFGKKKDHRKKEENEKNAKKKVNKIN